MKVDEQNENLRQIERTVYFSENTQNHLINGLTSS